MADSSQYIHDDKTFLRTANGIVHVETFKFQAQQSDQCSLAIYFKTLFDRALTSTA
jgi:hypothetical protein